MASRHGAVADLDVAERATADADALDPIRQVAGAFIQPHIAHSRRVLGHCRAAGLQSIAIDLDPAVGAMEFDVVAGADNSVKLTLLGIKPAATKAAA